MWNNTFSGDSDWQALVWRLSNNQVMREKPQGGWRSQVTLLRFHSELWFLTSPRRQREMSGPREKCLLFHALVLSHLQSFANMGHLQPSSEPSPGNKCLQFMRWATLLVLLLWKHYRRISSENHSLIWWLESYFPGWECPIYFLFIFSS